jgi:hypothetical protein
MSDALLLSVALLLTGAGLGWFALSIDAHWRRLRGGRPPRRRIVLLLRAFGCAALAGSLLLCLRVDHGSMASLVWVMMLTACALAVAFVLAWRPRWFTPLLCVVPRR